MSVVAQIWMISLINTLMTVFVGWQAFRLGQIMNATFGKWEALAWMVVILYRSYGLFYLSEDVDQLRNSGYIVNSLTFRQWVGIGGYTLFLLIIMYSKHLKRKRIRDVLGI